MEQSFKQSLLVNPSHNIVQGATKLHLRAPRRHGLKDSLAASVSSLLWGHLLHEPTATKEGADVVGGALEEELSAR